jgi:hypothetical protein
MHYDFIEIGTSDFRTLIQTCKDNETGLSIEPIKMYLDNLPDKPNVTKVNCAISNVNSTIEVFYVKPEDIIKFNLPNWVRGCNSINKPHPTVLNLLGDKHDSIITKEIVKVINWLKLNLRATYRYACQFFEPNSMHEPVYICFLSPKNSSFLISHFCHGFARISHFCHGNSA